MANEQGLSGDDIVTISGVATAAAIKAIGNTSTDGMGIVDAFIKEIMLEKPALYLLSISYINTLSSNHLRNAVLQLWIIDYVGTFIGMLPNNRVMLPALKDHLAYSLGAAHCVLGKTERVDLSHNLLPSTGVLDVAPTEENIDTVFRRNSWLVALAALKVFADFNSISLAINNYLPGETN